MSNIWKNRVQSTSSGSKPIGPTKSTTLQHLSPFASHSSQSTASPSVTSPKSGTELPSGVRYTDRNIRQTPTSVYRPITSRPLSATVTKRRERSPDKNLRFAEPVQCTRKHDCRSVDKVDAAPTKPTARARSTSRDRKLVRPVISAEPSPTECKRFSSHNYGHKVVATSPATRQTSPIFSTVDFGGDTNRNSSTKQSPTVEPIPNSRTNGYNSVNHIPPVPTQRSALERTVDRQPLIKTEISTPNGTVLKRSTSAVTTRANGNNGTVHRNNISFPIQTTTDRNLDQNRLSVNVNVAVGLDCNDNRMSHFMDQRYNNHLDTELNEVKDECEDVVDWAHNYDNGFAMQVAVRLRPFIQSEIDSKNNIPVIEMNGNTVRIINSDNDNYNRMEYGFDVCLNSSDRDLFDFADQDTVFKRMGEPLLERALEGYNVCLFAYGQTGSGKSFTITGTEGNPGIIPRFVNELYKRILSLTEVLFAVEVSYYEIYNEKIYDLLSDDKDYNKKILRVREHPQSGPYVENLSQHTVDGCEEVMNKLRSGSRRRATASTAANADSSRSHSIFTIILSQLKNNSDEMGLDMSCSCGSRINLIDLAGSERVGHSGTSGDRLREGSLINKSLLNLGKVISKLADYSANPNRTAHIPYRDSALTWLLKESLGGNSQTSMIATISPAKCHLEETLSTIRYAAKARQIVNFVRINEDPKTKKIRELMEIIAELRAQQRFEVIEPKDKDLPKDKPTSSDSSKNTSDESKDSSFDSQISNQKKVETKTIATNTSFVMDRRTSTKGTDTSFTEPVKDDKKKEKKSTANTATNTSFVKPPKMCTTGTETPPEKVPPKPKTVNTSTEMSFIEPKLVNTSTNTSFVELPSRLDLMRFKKLEEQEKQLLEDIRKHREKLLSDLKRKVEDWTPIGSGRSQSGDDPVSGSDTLSVDKYFDAEDVIENDSIKSNNTYVMSEDIVDQSYDNTYVSPQVVKHSSDKNSSKKKDKKKKKDDKKKRDKTDDNEWKTEDNTKTVEKTNEWNKEDIWSNQLEQIKEVDEEKQDSYQWGENYNNTEDNNNNNNAGNDWSVDGNATQAEDNVIANDEWGTDNNQNEEQNNNWETGGDNEWGNDNNKQPESNDNQNEWSLNENQTTEQTKDNTIADNWGTDDNQWTQEPNKSDEKQSSGKKSNKKSEKKDKKKDKKSEDKTSGKKDKKAEDKSNDWNQEESWDKQTSKRSKDNIQTDDWGTDQQSVKPKKSEEKQSSGKKSDQKDKKSETTDNNWGTEDNTNSEWGTTDEWGTTESADKSEDKPEEVDNWGEDTVDNPNKSDDNQFDWGTDNTDNTVIATNIKKESTEDWGDDVNEDNW